MAGGAIAARFRWGSAGLSYVGADFVGEVEDYRLANSLQPVLVYPAGDFDQSGLVDQDDYNLWKTTMGSADLRADGNNDGQVNAADYTVWRNNVGAVAASGAGVMLASGSGDESLASAASLDGGGAQSGRAAAIARALAYYQLDGGPVHYGVSDEVAAKLVAAGATPITFRVGNGTQTVYTFIDLNASLASAATAPEGDASSAWTVTSYETSSGSLQVNWLGVDAIASGGLLAAAVDQNDVLSGSPTSNTTTSSDDLLELVWSEFAPADEDDDDFLSLSGTDGESEEELSELALAAVFAEDESAELL
jgi:hypothetical protein